MTELASVIKRAGHWALIPFGTATIASIVMLVQGGFGAGHLPLDWLVDVLGLPAVLLLDNIWLPRFLFLSDFLLIVWFPAIINAIIWFLGALLVVFVRANMR
ncbi:MAG: hypothetical protein CVU55_02145 [Deltaproteobacteria bacterium HGW-Deltaproteobacteria-13]|jgi:hypothetical protein|nr:MAG: hypothetical protein CVU55_02145 [Deltaproteobacteria bacterium HGW-Deltaproteobacteria-13]